MLDEVILNCVGDLNYAHVLLTQCFPVTYTTPFGDNMEMFYDPTLSNHGGTQWRLICFRETSSLRFQSWWAVPRGYWRDDRNGFDLDKIMFSRQCKLAFHFIDDSKAGFEVDAGPLATQIKTIFGTLC